MGNINVVYRQPGIYIGIGTVIINIIDDNTVPLYRSYIIQDNPQNNIFTTERDITNCVMFA